MPDTTGAVDLGQPRRPEDERGSLAARLSASLSEATTTEQPDTEESGEPEAEQAPQVIPVHTAFIVFQTLEGETHITPDLNAPFVTSRPPTRDESYGMLSTAVKDMGVAEAATNAAQATVQLIEMKQQAALAAHQQQVAKAQEDAQNAAIEQEINRRGGFRG